MSPRTVKKGRLALAGLIIGGILAVGVGLFIYSADRARVSKLGKHPLLYYIRLRQFWREKFPPAQIIRLDVTGPTGTPVIVGYRLDGSRSGILRGVIPTNCVITARRRVEVAIKNMGTNCVRLGYELHGVSPGAPGGGGGSSGDYPQFYGFSAEDHWEPHEVGGGVTGTLLPTNWPVTLPPGMSEQESKTKDFDKELTYLRLKDTENRLEQNPTDQRLLAAAGSYYLKINNYSAAEGVYERFFATDCNDPMFLNIVVYEYADKGGTNLDRAYELAVKAQKLAEKVDRYQLSYIDDTVGWIQLKRGYLREALNTLSTVKAQGSWPPGAVEFHLAMARYMLIEEDAASEEFQKVIQLQKGIRTDTSEAEQARKCLAVLGLKHDLSDSTVPAKLKDRLNEEPDDPVALKYLAEINSPDGAPANEVNDPLVLKALGLRAYHSGEWSNAVVYLSRSRKIRAKDTQLLFYLGMAQNQLGQRIESADSLSKAVALGLNSAQIAEVNKLASTASSGNGTNSTRQ